MEGRWKVSGGAVEGKRRQRSRVRKGDEEQCEEDAVEAEITFAASEVAMASAPPSE